MRIAYTIFSLLAEMGGLGGVVFAVVGILCQYVTYVFIIDLFIQKYYTDSEGKIYGINTNTNIPTEDDIVKSQTIASKFSTSEILY